MKLLLTGGTGTVGVELLRLLIERGTTTEARVVIRASTPDELARRWAQLVDVASAGTMTPTDCPQLRAAAGDLTEPGLGLAPDDAAWVRDLATHVLHAAADIDFNATRERVRPVNVEGTRHALDVAGSARRLEAFGHVSTLYVAGRRTGLVLEDELEHDAGFVNPYEESKAEAEWLVREAMAKLPASIYRLSLLVGRQSDGYVHRYMEAHKMFELYASGRVQRIVGHPSHTLDMLPSDYAAGILARLFFDHFTAGRTYQISAGDVAPSAADIVQVFRTHLARPDWNVGWVSADEWRDRDADGTPLDGVSAAAEWMFDVVGEYLLRPKCFSRAATDAALVVPLPPPPVMDYLPRILARAAAEDWGRRR